MAKTPLTVYRTNTRGIKELVGVCDSWTEVGPMIYGNRDLIDWEATYIVEPEKEAQDEPSGDDIAVHDGQREYNVERGLS